MFSPHLKRNVRASVAVRQGFTFPSKVLSFRDTMQAPVVAINQTVLKSTTTFTGSTVAVRNSASWLGAELPLG